MKAAAAGGATAHTDSGAALTELVLTVFRLNGEFLQAAEEIAAPAGLTAARWQVLAGVLDQPRSVADVARQMGLARQSVQRLADILAAEGFAEYAENPAHRRASLLGISPAGRAAIQRLGNRQHAWANATSAGLPAATLRSATRTMRKLVQRLEKRL